MTGEVCGEPSRIDIMELELVKELRMRNHVKALAYLYLGGIKGRRVHPRAMLEKMRLVTESRAVSEQWNAGSETMLE